MAINRSQDSMSRCDPESYDNIYQVDKHRDIKSTHTQVGKYADTIERSASTEAMNRLQRPSENMVFQPSVLFRRIGKVVFLTVAMPPYFLLYGLPKWILTEGIQVLTVAMTWLANGLKEKAEKPLKIITQKLNLFVFLLQTFTKRLIKPVAELGIQLRQFFQSVAQRAIKSAQLIFAAPKKIIQKVLRMSQELVSRVMENFQRGWVNTKEWTKNQALLFNSKVREGLNWLKIAPQVLSGWSSSKLKSLNSIQASWAKKLVSKFQTSSKAAQKCTDWVGKQLGVVGELFKKAGTPFASFYERFIKPLMHLFIKALKSGANKSGDFFNNRKKRLLLFLENCQSKIKAVTPQQALDKLLPSSFLAKLPLFIRKILIQLKENRVTLTLFRLGLQATRFTVVNLSLLAQKMIEGISTFASKAKNCFLVLKERIKFLSKGTRETFNSCAKKTKNGSKTGFHGSLVLICMAGILLAWGFEALGETSTRWFSKISFFSKKTNV